MTLSAQIRAACRATQPTDEERQQREYTTGGHGGPRTVVVPHDGITLAELGRRLDPDSKTPEQLGWQVANGRRRYTLELLGRIVVALGCELRLGPETGHAFQAVLGPLDGVDDHR